MGHRKKHKKGKKKKKNKNKQQVESPQPRVVRGAEEQTNSTAVEDLDDPFPGLDRPPSTAELRALERLRVLVMDRVGRNKLVFYNDVRFDWREQLGGSVSAIFGAKPRRRVYALMQASSAWLVNKGLTPDARWPLAGMAVGYVEHELFRALRQKRAVMVQRVLDSFRVHAIEGVRGVDDARPVDVLLRTQDAASLEVLVRAGLECGNVQVADRLAEKDWFPRYNSSRKPTCSFAQEVLRSFVLDGRPSAKAMLCELLQSPPQGTSVIEAFVGVRKDFYRAEFKDETMAWRGLDSSLASVLAVAHANNPLLMPSRGWFEELLGHKHPLPLTAKEMMRYYTLNDSAIVAALMRMTAAVPDEVRYEAFCAHFQGLLDELLQRDPDCMKRYGARLLAGVVRDADGYMIRPAALQKRLIRLLLDNGASLEMADQGGQTAVHLALRLHRYRLVDAFLSLGLDPNATATPSGLPLLLYVLDAAMNAHTDGMSCELERLGRHLLRLGANPTSPYPGSGMDMYPRLQDYVNGCNLWLFFQRPAEARVLVKDVREHYMRYFGAQVCTFLCPLHEALRRRRAPDTPLTRFASSPLFDLNTLSMVLGFMSVREHTVDRRWRASRRDQVRAHEETRRQRAAQEMAEEGDV